MKTHTTLGAETLELVLEKYPCNDFICAGIDIARSHHEAWDGSGYPSGIRGEAIPLAARIMAVADFYDALRSKRSYKDALSHEGTRDLILQNSGTLFDPGVTVAFLEMEDSFREIVDCGPSTSLHP